MKQKFSIFIIAGILAGILISCSKELSLESNDPNYTSEQIEKIQYCYDYLNYLNYKGTDKLESRATEAYINVIKERLDEFNLNQRPSLKKSFGQYTVGVVKSGTCGSYGTFEILMDCENTNGNSGPTGWVGDWSVPSNKNVILRFCIVPQSGFTQYNIDPYSVLRLGYQSLPTYSSNTVYEVTRYFDNEDSSNDNYFTYLNAVPDAGPPWEWPQVITENSKLLFSYYPGDGGGTNFFPDLGISYGVLGTLSGFSDSFKGSMYFDDEDGSNANYCQLKTYVNDVLTNTNSISGNFNNIFSVGSNTRIYFTKVK